MLRVHQKNSDILGSDTTLELFLKPNVHFITQTKPNMMPQQKTQCTYSKTCQCGRRHRGETERQLDVSLSEHKTQSKTVNYRKTQTYPTSL